MCLIGYGFVLEVVQRAAASRMVSGQEAVSFMMAFTIAMLVLVLVRTTVEAPRKTLAKAWLRTLLIIFDYFLIFWVTTMCEANHTIIIARIVLSFFC
jgi:hypothetical protein